MTTPTQFQAPPQTNGMAVASLVLGIVWLFWLGSLLAIIFGHVALRQIDSSQGTQGGRGMAVAGLVLGYVGAGTFFIFIILPLLMAAGGATSLQ